MLQNTRSVGKTTWSVVCSHAIYPNMCLQNFAPFEVMFGRQDVLPIDLHSSTTMPIYCKIQAARDDKVEVRMLHRIQILEVVKKSICCTFQTK